MNLEFNRATEKIYYNSKWISAWSKVRTLKDGTRKITEVVRTEPLKGIPSPYDPQQIPVGVWMLGAPVAKNTPYLSPFFIPTSASRRVKIWSLKPDGSYDKETEEVQTDIGYGIHFSTSNTTLGCIRIARIEDMIQLVKDVREAIARKEKLTLTVV